MGSGVYFIIIITMVIINYFTFNKLAQHLERAQKRVIIFIYFT